MAEGYARPELLVTPAWLSERLGEPGLAILDCTTIIRLVEGRGATISPARDRYLEGHLPGARHVDIARQLSDTDSSLTLTAPDAATFAHAVGQLGIGDDTMVVAYTTGEPYWAARLWWLFRLNGLDNVSILDGGFARWVAEGRPVEHGEGPTPQPPQQVTVGRRGWILADKEDVAGALAGNGAKVVSARLPEHFSGAEGNAYARPGRISGSVNVPAASLYADDGTFLGAEEMRQRFNALGAMDTPVIVYCGLGVAASAVAFGLALLGKDDVALYDGSLEEWSADPSLPMESGA